MHTNIRKQNCTLKFGSWTYNGDQIDFRITCEANDTSENCSTRGEVDLSEYSNNGEFHLDGKYLITCWYLTLHFSSFFTYFLHSHQKGTL